MPAGRSYPRRAVGEEENLVAALEGGASAPAAILKAVSEREKVIAQVEGQIRSAAEPRVTPKFEVTIDWVRQTAG